MRKLYCDIIKEYEKLGYMVRITEDTEESGCYYLPHHGVYRPENSTTKHRSDFNSSNPSTSGESLNDILLKGEVKEDLCDIMTLFRKHKFAFLAAFAGIKRFEVS